MRPYPADAKNNSSLRSLDYEDPPDISTRQVCQNTLPLWFTCATAQWSYILGGFGSGLLLRTSTLKVQSRTALKAFQACNPMKGEAVLKWPLPFSVCWLMGTYSTVCQRGFCDTNLITLPVWHTDPISRSTADAIVFLEYNPQTDILCKQSYAFPCFTGT